MNKVLWIGTVLSLLAFAAAAQPPEEAIAKMKMQLEGSMLGQTVKGAPYAADEVTSSTQMLADGTRIHNESKVTVYRDGEGRVRRESSPDQITIIDPVAGASYFLNPKTLTAQKAPVMVNYRFNRTVTGGTAMLGIRTFDVHSSGEGATTVVINGNPVDPKLMAEAIARAKQNGESVTLNEPVAEDTIFFEKMAAGKMAAEKGLDKGLEKGAAEQMVLKEGGAKVAVQAKSRARGVSEDLGKQTIQGVSAQGTRTTSTIEVGAIGNDRPIQIVTERWYSPELQTVVMTKTSDPRIGDSSFELINVRRGEPGSYLFQVPSGYTVADRK